MFQIELRRQAHKDLKAHKDLNDPPDDEPSGYNYKLRFRGLADLSRLRNDSPGL